MKKMLDVIKEIVYEVTGKNDITMETDFLEDLALNSFDVMCIVGKFEERYDINIPIKDVRQLKKARDVVEYMERNGITESADMPQGGGEAI